MTSSEEGTQIALLTAAMKAIDHISVPMMKPSGKTVGGARSEKKSVNGKRRRSDASTRGSCRPARRRSIWKASASRSRNPSRSRRWRMGVRAVVKRGDWAELRDGRDSRGSLLVKVGNPGKVYNRNLGKSVNTGLRRVNFPGGGFKYVPEEHLVLVPPPKGIRNG